MFLYYLSLFLLGLIFGSFLTSFTDRIMHGESLPKGRSRCPKCKKQIVWYDNIPLFSYLRLKGKCRNCKKPISFRYPLIEFATGLIFAILGWFTMISVFALQGVQLNGLTLPFLLLIGIILLAIFVIDLEHQIIPDELSFAFLIVTFFIVLYSGTDGMYVHLLSGFLAALFLLFLHLITLGRGMGLGDVKLALGAGILLGWPYTFIWLMLSFVLGALIGVSLLVFGKAEFGRHIAFGPFLIIAFFIVLLWGNTFVGWWMPYL